MDQRERMKWFVPCTFNINKLYIMFIWRTENNSDLSLSLQKSNANHIFSNALVMEVYGQDIFLSFFFFFWSTYINPSIRKCVIWAVNDLSSIFCGKKKSLTCTELVILTTAMCLRYTVANLLLWEQWAKYNSTIYRL